MSNPSTADVTNFTLQNGVNQYHQDSNIPSTRQYASHDSVPVDPAQRLARSYHTIPSANQYTFQQQATSDNAQRPLPPPAMQNSHSTPTLRQNERRANWGEFYKNGLPKEIIVIDDDTPPPVRQQPQRTASKRGRAPPVAAGASAANSRKRKVDQGYEASYKDSPAFSTHPARFGENGASGEPSQSTDRTASLQTTAPTSLGSYGSSGASHSYEDVTVGQKRKRAVPQKETRSSTRRKQEANDAYADYVAPAKPIIKAPPVHVPVISDHPSNKNVKVDDEDGHYVVNPDVTLTARYRIVRLLGQGTFGKVVEAWDDKRQAKCAIKIIRSVQKYRDASQIELRVLSTLAMNDKLNRNKCIHLRDAFDFRNHICIVTDLLGQSVFDFLKGNSFVPFPSSQIQSFARQLFTSVAFLHDLNLIHTDLKPENILLVNGSYQTFTYNRNIPSSSHSSQRTARQRRVLLDSEIRLIDFGSATFNDEYHSSVVSTRHYRAPEIILNLGWSSPCDIWSIGCIIVEFFTGDALFQTHDNLEHLAMMEAVCGGRIDPKIVKQVQSGGRGSSGNSAAKFFVRTKLDYPNNETSKASKKYVKAMKHLQDFIPQHNAFNKQLLDLLKRIFVYDPKTRITAKAALKHPWFKETLMDDGTEAVRIRQERYLEQQEQRQIKRPRQG